MKALMNRVWSLAHQKAVQLTPALTRFAPDVCNLESWIIEITFRGSPLLILSAKLGLSIFQILGGNLLLFVIFRSRSE